MKNMTLVELHKAEDNAGFAVHTDARYIKYKGFNEEQNAFEYAIVVCDEYFETEDGMPGLYMLAECYVTQKKNGDYVIDYAGMPIGEFPSFVSAAIAADAA